MPARVEDPIDPDGKFRVTVKGIDGEPEWFAKLVLQLSEAGAIVKRKGPPDGKVVLVMKCDADQEGYVREILGQYVDVNSFARKRLRAQ